MERKLVSIWQSSLIDLHVFVAKHKLVDHMIGVLQDSQMPHSYWLMLKYTEEAALDLQRRCLPQRLTMI